MTEPQVLISRYLHGVLTDSQGVELSDWIKQDREHQRIFAREMYIHRCLYDLLVGNDTQGHILVADLDVSGVGKPDPEPDSNTDDFGKTQTHSEQIQGVSEMNRSDIEKIILGAIEQGEEIAAERAARESEQISDVMRKAAKEAAEAAFRKFQEQEQRLTRKLEPERYSYGLRERTIGLVALAASLIIVVSALFFIRKPNVPVAPQAVATLTETLNAKWDDSTLPTTIGSELFAGEMRLVKGYAQITFINGTEIVLQAPALLKLETAEQIFLRNGRLTAKVPSGAEGFKLNTPNAMMIDLGTEFGVIVSEAGQSELHVFKGEVKLFSEKRTGGNIYKQTFQAGQAGMVDKNGQLSEKSYKATPRCFVRSIPKKTTFGRPGERLDLSDVIGGGNGFGNGDSNQSINLDDGQRRAGFYPRNHLVVKGSSDYIPIADLDFIDGVFIPDGGAGDVVVSSQRHIFSECPDTNGEFCWDIFNGDATLLDHEYRTVLDGKQYGSFTNPAITIHSNAGITFDLDKIRASLPGSRIVAFTTLCGLSGRDTNKHIQFRADFWVLIDGRKRFGMTDSRWQSRASSVHVDLTEQDRFLTLIVTDGGKKEGTYNQNECDHDWGIFAEPALILAPENIVSK